MRRHADVNERAMKLIYANWKLNLPLPGAVDYAKELFRATEELSRKAEIVLFVSHTQLFPVSVVVQNTFLRTGAQDCSRFEEGAYTGEVSAAMCAAAGATSVLIGHSERRKFFAEDEQCLAEKYALAIKADLEPVLCIGETLEERKAGWVERVLDQQLQTLYAQKQLPERILVAYEPVWAIGTGVNATSEQIAEAHGLIIMKVKQQLGLTACVLYGGSVNPNNIEDILDTENVDGVLVGGASLKLETFLPLIQAAAVRNMTTS